MQESILCYACGHLVHVKSRGRITGRRRVGEEDDYFKARKQNNCPDCNMTLEFHTNLEAGRERMLVEHAEFIKRQPFKLKFRTKYEKKMASLNKPPKSPFLRPYEEEEDDDEDEES